MEWIETVKQALDYIEGNLKSQDLSVESVAKSINFSTGHFSRAFKVLTGFTVAEYIRNRRLAVAGKLLQRTDKTVLDVALEVGYDTPEAFTKAFKRFYGVTPKESNNIKLRCFPPLKVKLTLIQEEDLNVEIEEKGELVLHGDFKVAFDYEDQIAELWSEADKGGYLKSLYNLEDFKNEVGVYYNYGYTIKALGATKTKDSLIVPPHKWAIFKCTENLPEEIDITWEKIYNTWLPENNFKVADLPQLEVYKEYDSHYYCEIWIPLL